MIGTLLFALSLLLASLGCLLAAAEIALLTLPLGYLYQRANAGQRPARRVLEARTKHLSSCLAVLHVHGSLVRLSAVAVVCTSMSILTQWWWGLLTAGAFGMALLVIESRLRLVAAARSHRLVGLTSAALVMGCSPLIVWIPALVSAVGRGRKDAIATRSRSALAHATTSLLRLAAWHGPLARDEAKALSSLVAFEGITVAEVMTPSVAMAMLKEDTPLRLALASPETFAFAALPVFRDQREQVTGYILTADLLRAALAGTAPETPLSELRRPLLSVPRSAGIGRTLALLAKTEEVIAQVIESSGTSVGLVTRTDLLETVLGMDLADEPQRPSDIHRLAAELRDRRLAENRSRYVDLPQA